MFTISYALLSSVGIGLPMGLPPFLPVIPKLLIGFMSSEVNSESERTRGSKPRNVETLCYCCCELLRQSLLLKHRLLHSVSYALHVKRTCSKGGKR
jgi:hypothetical protein